MTFRSPKIQKNNLLPDKKSIILLTIILQLFRFSFLAWAQESDYYGKGLQLLSENRWEDALKLWQTGKEETEKSGKVDPRLGIAFIQTATAHEAKKYYDLASEMYMWGFSDSSAFAFPNVVLDEAQRILPLVEGDQLEIWLRCIREKSGHLLTLIRGFWISHDVRPSTDRNERLIEHWERIAYARKNFTKNRKSVYGTDDRGVIYVRYGAPDRFKHGYFGQSLDSHNVTLNWVPLSFFVEDPSPEYEIWAYDSLDTESPVLFLFSHRYGKGDFTLQPGVDYVIPEFLRGWRENYRAYYLIRYYAEVYRFDRFYYNRLNRLRALFETMAQESMLGNRFNRVKRYNHMILGISEAYKSKDLENPSDKMAVKQRSEYRKELVKVDVHNTTFRYLKDGHTPVIAVIASFHPVTDRLMPFQREKFMSSPHKFVTTLITYDDDFRQLDKQEKIFLTSRLDTVLFKQDITPGSRYLALGADVFEDTTLLAFGSSFIPTPEVTATNTAALELSDVLLGREQTISELYPFPVFPARYFTKKDSLHIYFELYGKQSQKQKKAFYSIKFEVGKVEDGRRTKVKRYPGLRVALFDWTSPKKIRYAIDLSDYKNGTYELSVLVMGPQTGQLVEQRSAFSILKQ